MQQFKNRLRVENQQSKLKSQINYMEKWTWQNLRMLFKTCPAFGTTYTSEIEN
jgi:hypothetical protein